MISSARGPSTSAAEVTNISVHGFWILVDDEELFLPFAEFPWFREATVAAIVDVRRLRGDHLHWPSLDVDLHLDSIRHPEEYPLVDRVGVGKGQS